jgi:plasmid maintenance system antidote protein VapI
MTLADYVQSKNLTTTAVAKELGISQPFAWRMIKGEKFASVELALRIEKWSRGKVKAAQVNKTLAAYADRKTQGRAA